MPVDSAFFRRVMGSFPTGVTIVTTVREGVPHGMTVNSLASVSLDPVLLLFCADHTTRTYEMVAHTGIFAVNLLSRDMQSLADRFSGRTGTREEDRFADLGFHTAQTGAPVLEGVIGWLDCKVVRAVEGGDHTIFLAEVVDAQLADDPENPDPLVFYRGRYVALAGSEL